MPDAKKVTIHADGACLGNPGPGGYGAVLRHGDSVKELSGGYRLTTNNRMELLGVIRGLQSLREPCAVAVFSDSKYIVDAMTRGWLRSWQQRGWRTANKQPVANQDLWHELLAAMAPHQVRWNWVKGHAGDRDNERCDVLANAAAKGRELAEDAGYLSGGVVGGLFDAGRRPRG